jgi:ATP-dependent metalloprotease
MHTLEWAKDRILMGAERKSAVIPDDEKRMTAYHEGGHALVALHTPGAHPVHKATVMPRGHALGFVLQLPDKDEVSVSRRQLQARLDVAMAGRVAEELIFGKDAVTTGASSDLSFATSLAQDMVTKWGFSEDKVGLPRHDWDGREMSPDTKKIVEEETKVMLAAAYERAKKILTEKGDELEVLAKAMIEKETLTGAQINELLAAHRKARGSTA